MEIYITRNGQRFGPYSILDAQNMVRSGNLHLTDHAWHEGLTNWVPLHQISGLKAVPAAPPVPTPTMSANQQPAPILKAPWWKKMGGVIAGAAIILFKFAAPLFVLLKTGGSMLLSIFAYSWAFHWTWQMAGLIVFLIFVHEMGHVIAAICVKVPVTAPLFIPFIGASITMKQSPRDAWTEAILAYGGPLAGCIGSWICWTVAIHMNEPWIMRAVLISFILNLFNMIPIPPLDGGRICSAVSSWFWALGLILLLTWVFYFHAWNSLVIIVLVLLSAIPRMRQTLFGAPTEAMKLYYKVHFADRLAMAFMYVGLIAALLLGYMMTHSYLIQG